MKRDHLLALIETNNALEEIGSADAKAISYIARVAAVRKASFLRSYTVLTVQTRQSLSTDSNEDPQKMTFAYLQMDYFT